MSKKNPAQTCDECGLGSRLGEEVHSTGCKKNKVGIDLPLRFNAYAIISRAVADGVAYGVRRSRKHTDTPTEDHISTEVENAVMNELCDVLQFGNDE